MRINVYKHTFIWNNTFLRHQISSNVNEMMPFKSVHWNEWTIFLSSGMRPSDCSAVGCQSDVTGLISEVMIRVSQELRLLTSSMSCSDKTRTLDLRWPATKHCSYSESSLKITSLRMSKDASEKRILRTTDVCIGAVIDIHVVWGMNTVMWFLINSCITLFILLSTFQVSSPISSETSTCPSTCKRSQRSSQNSTLGWGNSSAWKHTHETYCYGKRTFNLYWQLLCCFVLYFTVFMILEFRVVE